MLLAELEIRHSRAVAPTRRVALGELFLPVGEDSPGHGGLLLAAIVAGFVSELDDDARDGLDRLVVDLERGRRIAQPRLRHRFQTDTVGLDRSRHRLVAEGESAVLRLDGHAGALPQVLGATYAAAMLSYKVRPAMFRMLRRATRWEGDAGDALLRWLQGDEAAGLRRGGEFDERWALGILGFASAAEPARGDILRRFRTLVRDAHPDVGGERNGAATRITELTEAKRILLAGA